MPNNNAINNISLNQKVTQIAANYTALPSDVIIEVNNTAAPRTITLPTPTANNAGKFYVVKDTSGGAATNNISIFPASGLIDGSANLVIATNYGAIQVYSDGTSYYSQAFVIPNPTGIPLARASWARFLPGAGFTPGVTDPSSIVTASVLAPASARIDVTGLTQIIVPVNLTVAAQQVTVIRPGLYRINLCVTMISSAQTNIIGQVVKNGALVAVSLSNQSPAIADNATISYLDNFVTGDILDVRAGANGGTGSFLAITYNISQLPTTF